MQLGRGNRLGNLEGRPPTVALRLQDSPLKGFHEGCFQRGICYKVNEDFASAMLLVVFSGKMAADRETSATASCHERSGIVGLEEITDEDN